MHQKNWLFVLLLWCSAADATQYVEHDQRVFFAQDKQKLIAVDSQTARSIEFRLRVREDIVAVREGRASIAVATDQRLLAFSVLTGWRPLRLELREQLTRLRASGFSVFAETTQRILTFNGVTGKWFVRRKSPR